MLKRIAFICLLVSFGGFAQTQKAIYRFSGTVIDADTKEPLPGAAISIDNLKKAFLTDSEGNFNVRLPKGEFAVDFTFLGYRPYRQKYKVEQNVQVSIELSSLANEIEEVTITGSSNAGKSNMAIGLNTMSIKGIKKLPAIMGEIDILRSLQTLPGVSSIGEGANGVNVRGGNVDQNLIYVDDAPIFNPTHMFGLFSVFPADAIRGVELYKGNIPARFGGRTASVMNINMAEPTLDRTRFSFGIGPVSNKATLDVPIIKDKLGVLSSLRVSYNDFWLKLFGGPSISGTKANFTDFANKIYFKPNKKTVVSLSHYFSRDTYGVDSLFSIDNVVADYTMFKYGHNNLTARASHYFSSKLSANVTAVWAQFASNTYSNDSSNTFSLKNKTDYQSIRVNFDYSPTSLHKANFGLVVMKYNLEPGSLNQDIFSSISPLILPKEQSIEAAAYVSDEIEINKHWSIDLGLRFVKFFNLGPYKINEYVATEPRSVYSVLTSTQIAAGQTESIYGGFEPRLALKYNLGGDDALKLGYNRSQQFIHLVSNNTTPLPTARWKTSDRFIKPQVSDFLTIGYFKTLKSNIYEFSAETYLRTTKNVIDYVSGANLQLNPTLETQLLQGSGKAYGLELMMTKKKGENTGWLAYTYARAFQQILGDFPQIQQLNDGQWFPTNYDKPHTVNAVVNTQVAKRHSFSWNFAYSTGRPFNAPVGIYQVGDKKYPIYTQRNNDRISDYHRLDFSWTITNPSLKEKKYEGSWNFTVYNIYGRKNAFSYFFKTVPYGLVLAKLSVFSSPLLSLSYNFKWK